MSSPFPMFGSQDLTDDDGAVIDSFLIETDAPPKPEPEPIPILGKPTPTYPLRLVTGFQIVDSNITEPFPLFVPDTYRQFCKIRITSLNVTPDLNQYVLLASEKSYVQGVTARSGWAYRARNLHDLALDGYTGAIWVVGNALIATEGIEVSWILTTK